VVSWIEGVATEVEAERVLEVVSAEMGWSVDPADLAIR